MVLASESLLKPRVSPSTFEICQGIIGAGAHLANIGVHGKPVLLHMEKLRDCNVTLTTRLGRHSDHTHGSSRPFGRAISSPAS